MNRAMQSEIIMTLGRKSYVVESFNTASVMWREFIETHGFGASEIPYYPNVSTNGKSYRMSYNGKIWDEETCIYNPYVEPVKFRWCSEGSLAASRGVA